MDHGRGGVHSQDPDVDSPRRFCTKALSASAMAF